jgi:hypothetical protein
MAAQSYKLDTNFQSDQYKSREPIEKTDMTKYNSILGTIDGIMDENDYIMKKYDTSNDEVEKKLSIVKKRVSVEDVINNNNIILEISQKKNINMMSAAAAADENRRMTDQQKNLIKKLNIIDYTAIERKKNKYEYRLYQRYLKNLKRIEIEEIEKQQVEYMAKMFNKFTIVKLTGSAIAIGISLLLITSITSPLAWVQIGQTMLGTPFTFNVFTDIFWNFGIFNISDVSNLKNLFEMFLLDKEKNDLLKNADYIKALLTLIFTPLTVESVESLNVLFPFLNLKAFVVGKNLSEIKTTDILSLLKNNSHFIGHNNNNTITKLFLTIQSIVNKKNIFDPKNKLAFDTNWFEFVSNLYSSSQFSFFLTSCKLCYNVYGYINTQIETLQTAPNIDSNILFKGIAESALNSMSFSTYTNLMSTNFLKHIVGNRLDDVLISTILGDFKGDDINGFFITTLSSVTQIQVSSTIKGYFKKIETDAGYLTREERTKKMLEMKKDPVNEMELLIRKTGKLAGEGLTNEEITQAIYPEQYKTGPEYKFFGIRHLNTFYTTFKQFLNNPMVLLYSFANVTVIYNGLVNSIYTGLFGSSVYYFQRAVLTGWADEPLFFGGFKFNFLDFLTFIMPHVIGSDQAIIYNIKKLRTQMISDIIEDIQTLTLKLQNIFFDSRAGMSFNKYLRKVNDTILGSLFTTSCKVIYNIIVIPQLQIKLHNTLPEYKFELSKFLGDQNKVYRFFSFTNHRISNLYNTYFTTSTFTLQDVWNEMKKFTDVTTFVTENFLPYIAANNIYNYDELNVSNMKGNIIRILNDEGEKVYSKNIDRVMDKKYIDKSYVIVNKDLNDNYEVINYSDITSELETQINQNINDANHDELKKTSANDLFYMYYYTKFIESREPNYVFILDDFKKYMLKLEQDVRSNNNKSNSEMDIEYGVINNVIISIRERFNSNNLWRSFGKDIGLPFINNIEYDDKNFIKLPPEFQDQIQSFLSIQNTTNKFTRTKLSKPDIMKDTVILTIFTPNTYGYLPQSLKGIEFYSFKEIISSINNDDLTGDAMTQLAVLESLGQNNYLIKSDLALLNNIFKAPFRKILQNINIFNTGFNRDFSNPDINVPLKELGFDYSLFKTKIEQIIKINAPLLNENYLNDPEVVEYLVKLLDIEGVTITDKPDEYMSDFLDKLFTPEMLIKLSKATPSEIQEAQDTVLNNHRLQYVLPDFRKMQSITSYLKTFTSGIKIATTENGNTVTKTKTIFELIYETIKEQKKTGNPELTKLNVVLKNMVPKMYYDASIKTVIEAYFTNNNSPLDREHIVTKLKDKFNDLFKDIDNPQVDGVQENDLKKMKEIIELDDFKKIDLSDPTNVMPGGLLNINDIKGFFTTQNEIKMMENFTEITSKMKELRNILIVQNVNIFSNQNNSIRNKDDAPTLYEYRLLRNKWLDMNLEIYKTYRRKKAYLFYSDITTNRKIIDDQITDNISDYLKRLNTLYIKYQVSTNPGDTPNFKPQQRTPQDDPKDRTKRFPPNNRSRNGQKLPQREDVRNYIGQEIKNKVTEQQQEKVEIGEEVGEEVGEDEEQKEELKEQIAFAPDDIAESFFSFFSNMFDKLGTTNIADTDIGLPEDVIVKQPEILEKNAIDVCEQISGKWGIYDHSVKLYDTSIDINDAKRCNEVNMSQTFFEKINMSYKKSETILQYVYGVICSAASAAIWKSAGAAAAILATIAAISCIGVASPQASLLVIHFVFLYTFRSTGIRKTLLSTSAQRPTNFGYKILFTLWYHSFKSLTKIYTRLGETRPDYNKMCSGYVCGSLEILPGFDVAIRYQDIDTEADAIMQSLYEIIPESNNQINIENYNILGDIDIGQKTGDVNTSSLKDLVIKLGATNFISQDMKVTYNLLVEKNTKNELACSDMIYTIDNLKIAIYSLINSLIDNKKKEFFSDFLMCSFFGFKKYESVRQILTGLLHIAYKPNIFMKVFRDLIIIIISNKEIRPFVLSFLLGKESQGKNINFIRDIIDDEIEYLEAISLNNNSMTFDLSVFETNLRESITSQISNFFVQYHNLIGQIYDAFTGNKNSNKNRSQQQDKAWFLYDDFIACVKNTCTELKQKTKNIIEEMQTTILDLSGEMFINVIDLNKITDDNYILEEIDKQITLINTNSTSFKYKQGISQEDGENYLKKYEDFLKKYRVIVIKRIELDKFVKSKSNSETNPFYNFPLQNFLSAFNPLQKFKNKQPDIGVDLINTCNNSEVLIFIDTKYSCKKIEISSDLKSKLNTDEYSDKIEKERELLFREAYKFIDDINMINSEISELCNVKGLCSELASKNQIEDFIYEITKKITNLNDDQEEGFKILKEIISSYKTDASRILLTFEKTLKDKISNIDKLLSNRKIELSDGVKTPEEENVLQDNIQRLTIENENYKTSSKKLKEVKGKIDSMKPPDDISKITDFNTYLYSTLLKSIDVDKEPHFYAYVYLSNFDITGFSLKTEDLINVYDAFSSDELDFGKLILSDNTQIKYTDHKLNENLGNKDVKRYITTLVGEKILKNKITAEQFIKNRDPTLFIKKTGQQLPTKVKSALQLISSLSDKPITDVTPFNILFEYGYFLDKNKGKKSSLTLSKTWPKGNNKDLEDKEGLMVDYVFKTFSENNEDFFKYNKKTSFDDANKFKGSIPPILHGLNINTITNNDVKEFIQKNYEKVGGLWIFKPDLQLYSSTFKGFDKRKFAVKVEETTILTNKLKLNYRKGMGALEDELEKLEAESATAQKALKKAEREYAIQQKQEEEQKIENERIRLEEEEEERLRKEAEEERLRKEAEAAKVEAERLRKEQEEWDKKGLFAKVWSKTKDVTYNLGKSVEATATSATNAVVQTATNVGNKVVKGVILVKDVALGKEGIISAIKKTGNSLIKTTNYYTSVSLSETELKYFDAYVGVQFDYFNELDVNVENPYGLNKFSDYYKEYEYGTDEIFNSYYGYSQYLPIEATERINFISVFNDIFSPSIMSQPLSNAYYDVEADKILYNYDDIKPLEN